ncbi:MAG: alpha-L-fucosidase [Abditibacteriota bacterium]|nr:alpha-L-fucosidase [Abditibacteriota bacterium]
MNWHYNCNFGIHFDLHASEKDTELGAKITHENLKETLTLINPDWIQCDCKGHAGYTAWPTKYGYMAPGVIRNAMRVHADVCKELGIKLGMHYSGVIDTKACTEHPEWEAKAPKGKDGEAQGYSSEMKSVCPHSAYYDELMIPQMLELIEDYDVDGFWVDGDCWGVRLCYCDKCSSEFKEKYGIEPPTDQESKEWRLWTDYHRDLFVKNTNKYIEAVHAKKKDCLVISNWMLTFGAPIENVLHEDYISGDLSHNLGLRSAALEGHFLPNRGMDWDLMVWGFMSNDFGHWTAKTIPHLTQECAYIVACGGAVMIYETPHRNGLITRWHAEDYRKIGDFLKPRALVSRHSKSVPQVAVIHNPNDYWDDTNDGVYTINLTHPAYKRHIGAGTLLNECHYHYDYVMPSMVKGRLSDYKVVVLPEVYKLEEDFSEEIREYVKAGGSLLVTGLNCTKTMSDILGVSGEEIMKEGYNYLSAGNRVTTFGDTFTKVTPTSAKVLKYIMKNQIIGEDETENPAVTVNQYGKGVVVGVYFNMFESEADTHYPLNRVFFKEIMDNFPVEWKISDVEAPNYVHFNLREKEGKLIINLVNVGKVTTATELNNVDMVERIPQVPYLRFKVKADKEPTGVELIPAQTNIVTTYKEGYLTVEVKNLDIMESVVINL